MEGRVGHYCGRFVDGIWGEPQNSFSNIIFVIGAYYAWCAWRKAESRDPVVQIAFVLGALIGIGSFVFHSYPNPVTLYVDLVLIQIFVLVYFGYVGSRYFCANKTAIVLSIGTFFIIRQLWIAYMPKGLLGGGISHIPTLVLLIFCGIYFFSKLRRLSLFLFSASALYFTAVIIRSWDLYVCDSFPIGLHWTWHILTGLTVSVLLYAVATTRPLKQDSIRTYA
ncbi:MAG: hypothetical protein ACOY3V_08260 [Pseudomonadota bacterium]